MARLIGVVHGGVQRSILGERRELALLPSQELIDTLEQIPSTSVGLELHTPRDWRMLEDDFKARLDNRLMEGHYPAQPYWDAIVECCKRAGHEIIYLEDRDVWKRYNSASIRAASAERKLHVTMRNADEAKERSAHRRLVAAHETLYTTKVQRDKIHMIERDERILANIALSQPQVIIAGLGHTEYWMINQDSIRQRLGIEFEQYSTDDIMSDHNHQMVFRTNQHALKTRAYEVTSLEKAIAFLKSGRISKRKPDLVGTWDVMTPSRGYFEMFIERRDGELAHGTIEDLLGTASFTGTITPRHVEFTKTYMECSSKASRSEIKYRSNHALWNRHAHQGFYHGYCCHDVFYLERPQESTPLKMSMRWFDTWKEDEKVLAFSN